jgi:tripartite-type tricarboxylate transporter receptor subunit TctC
MERFKSLIRRISAGCAAACVTTASAADVFPDKPVRVIVPFAAGGAADVVLRVVSQKLVERWGQQLIIDNRPGAGGITGTELASKSSPTGYTLLLAAIAHSTQPGLYKKLPYDIATDFVPVTLIASTPSVVMLNPAVPAASVKDFIELAKKKPGEFNFGSPGNGTSSHLASELFCSMAQIRMTHISYRGTPAILVDVTAGRIHFYINTLPSAMPYVKAGKLKVLAVTSHARTALLPELPTVAEAGVPGYEIASWYGVLAPAGIPRSVLQKLNADFVGAIHDTAVTERLLQAGAEPAANTSQAFGLFLANEIRKWTKVMADAGIRPD